MSVPFTSYERIREELADWASDDASAYRALARAEWIVTEKIHGASFCFVVSEEGIRCAKRKALLEPGEDFFGHEAVLARCDAALRRLFAIVRSRCAYARAVLVYGELFGGAYPHSAVAAVPGTTPVQTGVWYAPRVEFCAFDVAVVGAGPSEDRAYLDFDEALACLGEAGVFAVRTLFRGSYEDAVAFPLGFDSLVPAALGLPPLASPNPAEGIVIKPSATVRVPGRAEPLRPVLKRKIPQFAEDARFHAAEKPAVHRVATGALESLCFEAASLATEPRLHAAVSKVGPARGAVRAARLEETYALVLEDLWTELREKHGHLVRSLAPAESMALTRYLEAEARTLVELYLGTSP
jgi:Rnl2 family RNA ligase